MTNEDKQKSLERQYYKDSKNTNHFEFADKVYCDSCPYNKRPKCAYKDEEKFPCAKAYNRMVRVRSFRVDERTKYSWGD